MVFLDTNLWNALVEVSLPFTVGDLRRAYREGRLVIVSTIEEFEEIMATARRRPKKYRTMRSTWTQLVSHRVLLPMNVRHLAEFEHRGVIPESARYLPAAVRRGVLKIATERPTVNEVNDRIYSLKKSTLDDDTSARDAVLEEIDRLGARRKDLNREVTVAIIDDWAADVVAAGEERGLPVLPPDEVSLSTVPSAWLMCGVTIARAVRVVRENRKVKDSDNHDRHHAAACAYFDVLVTDDSEFRETLALVPDLPCEVMSVDEFADWLLDAG
jgi:hypothetical protein